MSSLLSVGFFNRGDTRVDLKCDGKHPSESEKLTIDTIGVTNISIPSVTKLVGIGSNSDDLHGADRTRRRTSSSVAWVRLWRTSLVLEAIITFEHEPEGKEDRNDGDFIYEKRTESIASAAIEEWSGRYILGQRCKILLNACHKDRWSPECSAIILE